MKRNVILAPQSNWLIILNCNIERLLNFQVLWPNQQQASARADLSSKGLELVHQLRISNAFYLFIICCRASPY